MVSYPVTYYKGQNSSFYPNVLKLRARPVTCSYALGISIRRTFDSDENVNINYSALYSSFYVGISPVHLKRSDFVANFAMLHMNDSGN